MANRDETLRFIVETSGDENIIKLAKGLDAVAKSSSAAAPEAERLLGELEKLVTTSAKVDNLLKLKAALGETQTQLRDTEAHLAAINGGFVKFEGGTAESSKAVAKLERSIASLTKQQTAQEDALNKATGKLRAAGVDTENLAAASAKLSENQSKLGGQIQAFATNAEKAARATKSAADGTHSLGEESGKSASLIEDLKDHLAEIISIGAAVEAVMKGIEFGKEQFAGAEAVEASLSRVASLAKTASDQLGELGDSAEKGAEAVNVSTQNAADGLAALAGQGRDTAAAMEQLVPTLQLAKVAQIGVAESAAVVATAMDTFGESAGNAAHVADVLVAASKGSKGALGDLGTELGKLAPLARDINLSFDQTVGILGTLVSNGQNAGTAARGLASIFEQLKDPTSALRKELFALGDSTGDFDKAIAALTTTGPRGEEALNRLDGASRNVVLALGQLGPDAVAKFTAGLLAAGGEADRTAKALDDNLLGAATRFGNTIDRIGESLLTPILKPLQDEIVALADALEEFAKTPAFANIKTAIESMAKQGIASFDSFIRGIDWEKLSTDAATTISDIATTLRTLGDDLTIAGNAINLTVKGIVVAFNALETGVLGVATAITGILAAGAKGVELYLEALARIPGAGVVLGGTIKDIQQEVGGLTAVAAEFAKRTDTSFEGLKKAMDDFVAAAERAKGPAGDVAAPIEATGNAAAEAAPKISTLGNELRLVPDYIDGAVNGVTRLMGPLQNLGIATQKSAEASAAAAAASVKHGQELDVLRIFADGATKKMVDLALSGDTNSEAFQKAQAQYQKARAELDALTQKTPSTAAGLDAVKTAASALGITLTSQLQENAAKAEKGLDDLAGQLGKNGVVLQDVRAAFDVWAASARAAVANADDAAKAQVETLIKVKAQLLNLGDAAQKTSAAAKQSAAELSNAGKAGSDSFSRVTAGANQAAAATAGVADAAGDMEERGGALINKLADEMAAMRGEFAKVSEGAAVAFDAVVGDLDRVRTSIGAGLGFDTVRAEFATASTQIRSEIEAQKTQLDGVIGSLSAYGTEGATAFNQVGADAKQTTAFLDGQLEAIKQGRSQFTLLGKEDLGRLNAALEEAKQRVQALDAQAKAAAQSLQDMADQTQSEINQAKGDVVAEESARHEKALKNIAEEAKAAGDAGKEAAQDAIAKENELHALKLKNIDDQKKEATDLNVNKTSSTTTDSTSTSTSSRAVSSTLTINLNIGGSLAGTFDVGNLTDAQITQLANVIIAKARGPLTQAVIDQLRSEMRRA